MKKTAQYFLTAIIILYITPCIACAGAAQAASSPTRGQYLAEQGIVIPPEEIHIDSYIAAINYKYPAPDSEMGIYLYNSTGQMNAQGQEGILHIGIQGRTQSYDSLPPMNLAFVIDSSSSMNEQDKIEWVKESVEIFMKKIRDIDYLALICFNDTAQVVFDSTRMDTPAKRQRFIDAVKGIKPQGSADLEAGLKAGYEQLLANFREGSVNRLLFFSDGTEFSQRLAREGAQTGDIRISLIWNNTNDLDLRVVTPLGEEIFYGSKRDTRGGYLDVDMNVRGETNKPVENIFWPAGRAPEGRYRVYVQNYAFHERNRAPYAFQVEVKNGNNYSSFEGTVSGSGRSSNTEVCVFDFRGETALRREKALVYQMAESYRELGITISTLGVGVGFDVDLMKTLAEEGGGSSRFLSSREEMIKTFDTEFERMAVLAARDLEMELEFMEGIEIIETWGYRNRIEKNRVHYSLTGLHLGDYETILVRYRIPPMPGGEINLANFIVNAKDVNGRRLSPVTQTLSVNISGTPVDGISTGKLLYSGTMLHLAQALREIGTLYYDGGSRNNLSALEQCLKLTLSIRSETESARLRLDDNNAFSEELGILNRYEELFRRQIIAAGGTAPEINPVETPVTPGAPTNLEAVQTKVTSLFREVLLSLQKNAAPGEIPVAALASFALRDGSEPPLVTFLNQSGITVLAGSPGLRLVERERIDLIRNEHGLRSEELLDADTAIRLGRLLGARYIITGQIIPMSGQVIVFGRVINVETGEIVSAAQIFLDREALGDLI